MKLSEISSRPVYTTTLPSTGRPVKFTPFSVKDERALLTAQESDNPHTILNTLVSVIKSCIRDDVKLSSFDVEFLFMQIRAKSVGEISTLNFICDSCQVQTPVMFDITKAEVAGVSKDLVVQLNSGLSVKMKYIGIDELLELDSEQNSETILSKTISSSIEYIVTGDEIVQVKDEPIEEIAKFIDDLPSREFNKLTEFIENSPTVSIQIKWQCSGCKLDHTSNLKGLSNLFS
jgi:hypothetical protein